MLPKLFVHKFESEKSRNKYLYDVNSQEIIKVDDLFYDVIDDVGILNNEDIFDKWENKYITKKINSVLKKVVRAQNEGLLSVNTHARMVKPVCKECLEEHIRSSSGKLILNITQNCNLRCIYCAFSGLYEFSRKHRKYSMDKAIAKKAISQFIEMMKNNPQLNISFYGGEPLLEFKLITELIDYTRSKSNNNQEVIFHIDTNGTLLTDRIIKYLIDNDIYLQISLDGPKEIHDRYRVFKNGAGTYDLIMKNMEKMKQSNIDYYNYKLSFSTTIAPPYDLNSINEFFKSPSLPAINVLVNFVDAYDTKFYEIYSNPDDNKIFSKQMASLRNNYINSRISGEEPSLVEKGIFESSIVRIHTRARENINGCFPPNGICVPGVRRRFVESDGSIYPCERTGNAFSVGSVQKGGVDQKRGFNLIDEYISNSEKYCSECWAQRLCGLCFATACRNGKYSQSRKNGYCITEKSSIHESLKTYVSVLENNSAGYDFVKDMKFD